MKTGQVEKLQLTAHLADTHSGQVVLFEYYKPLLKVVDQKATVETEMAYYVTDHFDLGDEIIVPASFSCNVNGTVSQIKPQSLKQVVVEGDEVDLKGKLVATDMAFGQSIIKMTYPFKAGIVDGNTEVLFTSRQEVPLQQTFEFDSLKAYLLNDKNFHQVKQALSVSQDLSIFVPIDALCQFEIMHGQWVTLRSEKGKQVKAQVYSLNDKLYLEDQPQDVVFVSSVINALLELQEGSTIKIEDAQDVEFLVADSVKLSCAFTSSNVELEHGLLPDGVTMHKYRGFKQKVVQNYFKKQQRIVTDGQIIALTVDFYDLFDGEVIKTRQSSKQIQFMFQVSGVGSSFKAVSSVDSKVELEPSCINLGVPLGMFKDDDFDMFTVYSEQFAEVSDLMQQVGRSVLVSGEPDCGVEVLVKQTSLNNGLHQHVIHCHSMSGYSSTDIVAYVNQQFQIVSELAPCVVYLKDVDAIQVKPVGLAEEQHQSNLIAKEERMVEQAISNALKEAQKHASGKIVMVGSTCKDVDDVPKDLLGLFDQQVVLKNGNKIPLLKHVMKQYAASDVDWNDLEKDVVALQYHGIVKMSNYYQMTMDNPDKLLDHLDLKELLQNYQKVYSSKSKFSLAHIPSVTFADVGGLNQAKEEIYNTLILPLQDPQQKNFSRTGLLFYGPPGCGKSMLAKAIANELQCTFLSVKGPELMNMYVGETEKNVRDLFNKARQSKRAIIFFDELDSMAPRRESEAVMSRVVSQLLAEMDAVHQVTDDSMIFVIGATNRPDLLDSSLLRPGRFDRLVYLETPQTLQEQMAILKAASRKLTLHQSVDFDDICDMIPLNVWTGADYNAVCVEALMLAISRSIETLEGAMHGKKRSKLTVNQFLEQHPEYKKVEVTHGDFAKAIDQAKPSVSAKELEHYRTIQRQFRNVN